MTEKHKKIITSNYEGLVALNAEQVMTTLLSDGIITPEDQEDINSKETRTKKAKALLDLLLNKQDRAYGVLRGALKKHGNPELALILDEAGGQVIVVSEMQSIDWHQVETAFSFIHCADNANTVRTMQILCRQCRHYADNADIVRVI